MARDAVPRTYPVNLVGEQHYRDAIKRCHAGETVWLRPEPDNAHDEFAIAVIDTLGDTLGYVPRDNFVQRLIHDEGKAVKAVIDSIGAGRRPDIVLTVTILKGDDPTSTLLEPGAPPPGGGEGGCLGTLLLLVAVGTAAAPLIA